MDDVSQTDLKKIQDYLEWVIQKTIPDKGMRIIGVSSVDGMLCSPKTDTSNPFLGAEDAPSNGRQASGEPVQCVEVHCVVGKTNDADRLQLETALRDRIKGRRAFRHSVINDQPRVSWVESDTSASSLLITGSLRAILNADIRNDREYQRHLSSSPKR